MNTNKSSQVSSVLKHIFMVLISLFMLFPLLWALITSLKPKELVNHYPPVFFSKDMNLENFKYIFNSGNIPVLLRNTTIYAVSSTLIAILCAALASYILSRYKFKGKRAVHLIILCPMLIPGITNMIPLYDVYGKLGWVNTFHGLILLYLPSLLPFSIVILQNYMAGIPVALEESAMIDGCNRVQILLKIIFPILKPGLLSVFLINFITVWNDFLLTLIFTNNVKMQTMTLELYKIAQMQTIHNGITNATAVICLVPVLILFLVFRNKFINSMLEGAVKG